MELSELFGELRSLLDESPCNHVWSRIEYTLCRFEDDDLLEQVVAPYLLEHFERAWPPALERPARMSWYDDDLTPARKRALGSLATAPCPFCTRAVDASEVSGALKFRYGKRFAKVVRTRDVMTGKEVDATWACDSCRRFTCHGCESEQTVSWTPPQPEPSRHEQPRATRRSRRRRRQAVPEYEDVPSWCKDCGVRFVFTAAEQRVWYEEYGIPRHYHGMWDSQVPIVRRRCDGCQEQHMAQKRIGQMLSGAGPGDAAQAHRALERDYTTLGNEPRAAYHRNVARRLEGDDA